MNYDKYYYDITRLYNILNQKKNILDSIVISDFWKGKTALIFFGKVNQIGVQISIVLSHIEALLEAISYIKLSNSEDSKVRTLETQMKNLEFQDNFAEIYETQEYQEMINNKSTSERISKNYIDSAKLALEKILIVANSNFPKLKPITGFVYDDLMDPIKGTFNGYNLFSKNVKLLNVNPKVNPKADKDSTPQITSTTNENNVIKNAEKYIGVPYVWGGYSPKSGFDCSGYVSYVLKESGYNVERTNCNGLKSKCQTVSASELQPGDLVFFQGTYNTTGASHIGIYVGDGKMIHCGGSAVGYASLSSKYWQSHLLSYGRIS